MTSTAPCCPATGAWRKRVLEPVQPGRLYTTDGAVGSVKDYYKEVSYGKLTMDSTITIWVKLPREEAYYGHGAHGGMPGVMAADAVEAADAAGVDFSQGDSDGDGWVDVLDVIHSGYGEEADRRLHPDWSGRSRGR